LGTHATSEEAHGRKSPAQIYFCDRPTRLSILHRADIPKEKMAVIRQLHRRESKYNFRMLFFFSLGAAMGYLALTFDRWLVQLFCCIMAGWSIVGLTVLMHDGVHGLLSTNPILNRWAGFICSAPALVSHSAYRSVHLLHHRYEHTDQDPDDAEAFVKKTSFPLVWFYYLYAAIGAYLYVFHINIDGYKLADGKNRVNILFEWALIMGLFGIAIRLFPFESILQVWFFPWLVAAQITSFRGVPEHAVTTGGNVFTATRTVLSNKFVSFMLCNANYHLEHHLFPGMPWYNLPKVHKLLQSEYQRAGASVYLSYTEFYIDFFRSSLHGILPNIRLIPNRMRQAIGCSPEYVSEKSARVYTNQTGF